MWGMIVSLVQGIVTGVVGPAFTYLGKKQDVTLDGFKSGTESDRQTTLAWLDYQTKIQALKLQASSWWGPRALYMLAGSFACLHFAGVCLVSMSIWLHDRWTVLALPKPYDTYEGWIVGSLFVVSIAKGPLSAATSWLQQRR